MNDDLDDFFVDFADYRKEKPTKNEAELLIIYGEWVENHLLPYMRRRDGEL
jgi:hypothetical protein